MIEAIELKKEIERVVTSYGCISGASIPTQEHMMDGGPIAYLTAGALTKSIVTMKDLQEFEDYCKMVESHNNNFGTDFTRPHARLRVIETRKQ